MGTSGSVVQSDSVGFARSPHGAVLPAAFWVERTTQDINLGLQDLIIVHIHPSVCARGARSTWERLNRLVIDVHDGAKLRKKFESEETLAAAQPTPHCCLLQRGAAGPI